MAWQKHKAARSLGSKASKKLPFWTIYEAELVLSVWKAKRLNGFNTKFQEGQRDDISFEEFVARVEAIAHPGKSSLLKMQRLCSLILDSHAKRPSIPPGLFPPVFLWQVVVVLIALAIVVPFPVLFLAGDTIEFPLLDRSCHLSLAPSIWLQIHSQTVEENEGEIGDLDLQSVVCVPLWSATCLT